MADATKTAADLHGTWRLIKFERKVLASGETVPLFGASPTGYLTYAPEGRMMAVICASGRPQPESIAGIADKHGVELFRTVVAYAGTYTFHGDTVVHHVDASWNEIWTGSDQLRHVRFEGDHLVLTTDPGPAAAGGAVGTSSLTWEKIVA